MNVQARILTLELLEEEKKSNGFLKSIGVDILLKDTKFVDNKINKTLKNDSYYRR